MRNNVQFRSCRICIVGASIPRPSGIFSIESHGSCNPTQLLDALAMACSRMENHTSRRYTPALRVVLSSQKLGSTPLQSRPPRVMQSAGQSNTNAHELSSRIYSRVSQLTSDRHEIKTEDPLLICLSRMQTASTS